MTKNSKAKLWRPPKIGWNNF